MLSGYNGGARKYSWIYDYQEREWRKRCAYRVGSALVVSAVCRDQERGTEDARWAVVAAQSQQADWKVSGFTPEYTTSIRS